MNLDLKGKNALVCGSTQGIGKASAMELALLGANVTLVARNEDALKATLRELDASKGQKHNYLVADFTDPSSLKTKAEEQVKSKGPVHILVNNTGGPKGGPIAEAKTEEFTQTFSNHLICNHILVQAVLDGMKKEKYGRIINIISTSVKQPIKGLGVSNTIRAAVGNWAKTLSLELASFGITVNNVLPGMTDTKRLRDLISAKAKAAGRTDAEIEKEMIAEIPAGRLAEAKEIAAAVAFLATPAAAYINGTNVTVDGGRTGNL
jgi:3-oxoacyl-[acyl-carrier protein] reductase